MKIEDVSKAACLVGLFFVLLAGAYLVYDYFRQPAPVRQSPLPQVAAVAPESPSAVAPPVRAKKPARKLCIFVEHGIGPGCRYDDAFLAKVGRDGVKAYGWPEVNTDDNVGN